MPATSQLDWLSSTTAIIVWILGGLFTTLAYFRMAPVKGGIDPTA